jgi:hypothetical protein
VTVTFGNVATAGNLTAKAIAGQHPNITSSAINPSKDVNLYWNLTNTGITFDNYGATFNFSPADILNSANTANFIVGRYDGAAWTYPTTGTKTATSTQATGIASFSDFVVGEQTPVPAKIAFITTAQPITAGSASGITIQAQNNGGTPANVAADTTVTLTSTAATGKFATSAAGPFTLTSVIITAGANSTSFYYNDTVAGTPTLTAASAGLTNGTQTETIIAAAAAKIVFTTNPQTINAGTSSQVMTIQTQDTYNNTANVTGSTVVNLTTTAAATGKFATSAVGPFNITSVTIPVGSNFASFYYNDTTVGTPTLTAASGSLTNGTQTETIITAGTPSKIAFTSLAQNITAGSASSVITIQTQDAGGNPANVGADIVVGLTTTSSGKFDTLVSGPFSGTITSVTILSGSSSASFYYNDTLVGTPTLTAANGDN